MVAATALLAVERVRAVGILDCDMHYGDGTDDILRRLDLRARVRHFTAGAEYHRPEQAEQFLALLPSLVHSMRDCGVILYQAGADPHVNDPLGGWLDDAQLRRRDSMVFTAARDLGVPIAWNLAGGYQRDADGGIAPVLAIHAATAREAVAVFLDKPHAGACG
jgi:acetoin utilization deacetylase AcuC-like enzyme